MSTLTVTEFVGVKFGGGFDGDQEHLSCKQTKKNYINLSFIKLFCKIYSQIENIYAVGTL